MVTEEYGETAKCMKPSMDCMAEDDRNAIGRVSGEDTEGDGNTIVGSEQMLMEITCIHEKINRFTELNPQGKHG